MDAVTHSTPATPPTPGAPATPPTPGTQSSAPLTPPTPGTRPSAAHRATMRAVVQDRYGPLTQMRLREVPVPAPGPGRVAVEVAAAGVDAGIWHLMTGTPYLVRLTMGLRRPRVPVPGWDVAGVVMAVGEGVTTHRPGDQVFGSVSGAFAEVAVGRAEHLLPLPVGLTAVQAAAVPTSGLTALQALRRARLSPGAEVAVLGAGGGVGHFAVQLAALAGARVTGVCSAGKAEVVRGLGAHAVLDYRQRDVTDGDLRYDAVIDTAGRRPLRALRRILTADGTLVLVGGEPSGPRLLGMGREVGATLLSPLVSQRLTGMLAQVTHDDLAELAGLLADGTLRPHVDRTFPLERAVDAVQHVRDGRAAGKVVVTLA